MPRHIHPIVRRRLPRIVLNIINIQKKHEKRQNDVLIFYVAITRRQPTTNTNRWKKINTSYCYLQTTESLLQLFIQNSDMQPSRLERVACYALAVQLYFSTTAFSFTSSPTSRNSNLLGGLAAIRRDDPASPPAFDAASLPPPEKLPDDVPDVSKESLKKAINSKERTLYEILGASSTATRAELKKNYVEMAKLSHPDAQIGKVSISDAPDFGEVAAAWRVLGDSKSRKRYDRELQYKEWAAYASNYANEKMEEAVPAVAKIMDDLALPFLRRTAATTVAVSQAVSNIAKTGANPTSQTGSDADNKNSLTDAFMNAIRAGQKAGRAIDTLELNEKYAQLQER